MANEITVTFTVDFDRDDISSINEMIGIGVNYWMRGLTADERVGVFSDYALIDAEEEMESEKVNIIEWNDEDLVDMVAAYLEYRPEKFSRLSVARGRFQGRQRRRGVPCEAR